MKKVKSLAALALAAISSLSFAACRGNSDNPNNETIDASRTQLYVNNYSGGYGVEWLTQVKKDYEALHAEDVYEEDKKGIQIVINNTRTSLTKDTVLGNVDEVYFTEHVFYHDFLAQGMFADVTEAVTGKNKYDNDKTVASKLSKQQEKSYNVDGKYYGIPHYSGAYGFIYNKELFEAEGFYLIQNIPDDAKIDDISGSLTQYFDYLGQGKTAYTAGPDGEKGTDDDGLPATYTEFFALCEYISLAGENYTPIIWTGKYREQHLMGLLSSMLADSEGLQQSMLRLEFDGTATELGKIVNGEFLLDSEPTKITSDNGYELSRQASVYYALKFLENLLNNTEYYNSKDGAFNDAFEHTDAQSKFVWSGVNGNKKYAMLVDGDWWEEEATDSFNKMVQFDGNGDRYKKENRDFGWLPLPKATRNKVGQKGVIYDTRASMCFVKANTAAWKMPIAIDFLQYVNSDAKLVEFSQITNTFKALNYTMDEEALAKLTPFGRSVYTYRQNTDILQLTSTNSLYSNNQKTLAPSELFAATNPSSQATWFYPVNVFRDENGKQVASAETYFTAINTYFSGIWSGLSR